MYVVIAQVNCRLFTKTIEHVRKDHIYIHETRYIQLIHETRYIQLIHETRYIQLITDYLKQRHITNTID